MEHEEWRGIAGRPGYQASSLGRIRNAVTGHVLSPRRNNSGYPVVTMGRGHHWTVHKAVASAFHGERPDGSEVMHLDDDKSNCRPENLRYGTRAENVAQKLRNGRQVSGDRHGMAKFKDEQLLQAMGAAIKTGVGAAAKEFGVSRPHLSGLLLGKYRPHLRLALFGAATK